MGEATHLGRHYGEGSVQTDTADFSNLPASITGEFGGGSPFVFCGANGDKLVTWYGRTDHGAEAPGTFTLTILDVTEQGAPIVEAHWIAEFVVQPDESTGKFAGATGSWIMDASASPSSSVPMTRSFTAGKAEAKSSSPNSRRSRFAPLSICFHLLLRERSDI